MNSYLTVLKKYATFSGRARRQEYWMFFLFNMIISFVLTFLGGIIGAATESGIGVLLSSLYGLIIFIPAIAVLVRRLHDTDRSGWWALGMIVPLLNIAVLVFLFLEGTRGENRFGADPKADSALPAAA